MKNIKLLSLLMCCMFLTAACSEKTMPPKMEKPVVTDDIPSEVATSVYDKAPVTDKGVPQIGELEEDCHGKRKLGNVLEEVEGSILKIGDKYVISTNNGNKRYNPCELPKKLKVDGMLVRFSGTILEIFPNERLIATPFRLKNIVERD